MDSLIQLHEIKKRSEQRKKKYDDDTENMTLEQKSIYDQDYVKKILERIEKNNITLNEIVNGFCKNK